ncbi:MAG: hypothetical protein IJO61_02570 [Oscillospiraceae bacterium]|nr:hypothetical protein [Oscillospiraceae bacterium]MBQ6845994.1 hypothetical protein [Oscillospiraceae bacterium]MBQ7119865.1 hypothetical protein [Oscillospiraceae bacterium]
MAEGHRGRYRDRFENENIDNIPEYAVLEKLLHGVIVRKDTSDLARTLIREFGSFANVIDASPEELEKIKGVGPSVSAYITALPNFYARYCKCRAENGGTFESRAELIDFLQDRIRKSGEDSIAVICFDATLKYISSDIVVDSIERSQKKYETKVIDYVVSSNASRVIVAHKSDKSRDDGYISDLRIVKPIYNTLKEIGVIYDDHILIYDDADWVSLDKINKLPKYIGE